MAYTLTNLPSAITALPEVETSPPMTILWACSLLSAVPMVAGIVAWRNGSRPAARLTPASMMIVTLTLLQALFVDVPAAIKILVTPGVVLRLSSPC
jgi:hypothetical protein